MKESKNSLIGKIPSHWEERKIKYCFFERSEKNHPDEKYWMKEGEVIQKTKGKK